MKRINKETGQFYKQGDVREDGYIFWGYSKNRMKKDGFFMERWVNPETFATCKSVGIEAINARNYHRYHNDAEFKEHRKTQNKEAARKQKTTKEGHVYQIFQRRKFGAQQKGIAFSITLSYALSIVVDVCPILNVPLAWCKKTGTITANSPSIDKIDPELGYVEGNVQWVSFKANAMKQNATKEELLQFSKWIRKTFESN